jgi:hypothetical protein
MHAVPWKGVLKFIAHGRQTLHLATKLGWRPAARYTNLRDVRGFPFAGHGFLDVHWRKYDFERHVQATAELRPLMTVARDVQTSKHLDKILGEAERLQHYAKIVVIVPKDRRLAKHLCDSIPSNFVLGFSVPTRYGATVIHPRHFQRPVHLLGGRPDVQRVLASQMPVVSLDCNRFTLDAQFGDYFDGETFRPHPRGGYMRCLRDSARNIERLWHNYDPLANRPKGGSL